MFASGLSLNIAFTLENLEENYDIPVLTERLHNWVDGLITFRKFENMPYILIPNTSQISMLYRF